ncbi:MAG TPA: ABC transporter permease subunit, partial [Rhodothermia bacterium]|nr:ABC transporter permease subunit [Rhodothermia bacterium]
IIYVLISSFDVAEVGAPYRFGTESWREIFTNEKTWSSVLYSFGLAVRVPLATCVGFAIAWLLVRVSIPGSRVFELAFWFTFLLPSLPLLLGWTLLLDANYGLVNLVLMKLPFVTGPVFSIYSAAGIVWVHMAMTTVPIMVILLSPSLRQLDRAYEEAAEMSGAGLAMRLKRVTIPLVFPAIATAFILSLIRSLEAFEVERVLGTPVNINVYSTRIYDFISLEPPEFPQAMALSCLFLVILLALAICYQRYLDRAGDRSVITGRGAHLPVMQRARWHYVASALLWVYLAVTLLLPLVFLILGSLTELFGFFFTPDPWTVSHWKAVFADSRFIGSAVTSMILGLAVGIIGILIFSLVAWLLVRTTIAGRGTVSVMIWLPWAIPGLVLGVTLLSLILETPGLSLLYGTIIPLLLALLIKELPVGVQLLRTAVGQVSAQLEDAAVMSGAGFMTVYRRITLPLVAPMLVSVFLLIFAGTLRDIGTIVLIATPGTQTMSLLMFEFAVSGQLESAAVIGVIVAVVCTAVTSISLRIGRRVSIRG